MVPYYKLMCRKWAMVSGSSHRCSSGLRSVGHHNTLHCAHQVRQQPCMQARQFHITPEVWHTGTSCCPLEVVMSHTLRVCDITTSNPHSRLLTPLKPSQQVELWSRPCSHALPERWGPPGGCPPPPSTPFTSSQQAVLWCRAPPPLHPPPPPHPPSPPQYPHSPSTSLTPAPSQPSQLWQHTTKTYQN